MGCLWVAYPLLIPCLWVARKYYESIHMYRLCIGYVSVILYAGPDVVGSHFRISLL